MASQLQKISKLYVLRIDKYQLKYILKLVLYQVASVAIFVFCYAVLVVWPSQDEVLKYTRFNENVAGKVTCEDNGVKYYQRLPNYTNALREDAKRIISTTIDPVIVWWTEFSSWKIDRYCSSGKTCKIFRAPFQIDRGAYLFYGSEIDFGNLPLPRRSGSIIWGLFHEESPTNVAELLYERGLNLFNFSSTFSRYSDVPIPLAHVGSVERITNKAYFVETARKSFYISKGLAPVLYIQSDCDTATERDDYVRELFKYIDIDSYGDCLNTKKLPDFSFGTDYLNNFNNDKFLKFIARYKFTIAIENGVCNDYITEKLWRPIQLGSIPIYFGSPTIRDWLPNNKSAILLEDYRTPKALSEHLKKLLADDKLYKEYLEHKTKGIITNNRFIHELKIRPYQSDFKDAFAEFECFICDKLHDINTEVNVVNKSHYDCPKPISALSLGVNPRNFWTYAWDSLERQVDEIYGRVFGVI